ncbi:hypothetical protein K0M31_011899 [Melipona bicolor]|uniref:Uncharacterized protein n=1 Tax=Melipona bicolor TaxID=60889 RepID=A0AA40GAN8_9HYME|nr:hypothetical protein K0M31_011899 [Melipona bicolor]
MGLLMALDERKLLEKGEYWVVGVDIEQYDEKRPDKYFRGLWQEKTNSSILKAYRSYFSVVASTPIYSKNFTRMVNEYRQKPPFNFTNPLANMGGIIQIVPETAYLYDAVHLYERSLLKALDENRDPRNGREIVATLYGVHYRSAMGYVQRATTRWIASRGRVRRANQFQFSERRENHAENETLLPRLDAACIFAEVIVVCMPFAYRVDKDGSEAIRHSAKNSLLGDKGRIMHGSRVRVRNTMRCASLRLGFSGKNED